MALADAAAGMNSAVQQILLQKLEAQRYADQQKQVAFENARQTKGDSLDERRIGLQEQEHAATRAEKEQQDRIHQGDILNEAIPSGTALPPTDTRIGYLRAAGAGLTHQDPTLASTQFSGASTLPQASGASMPTATPMRGVLKTISNPGNPEQYIKEASQKQTQAANTQSDRLADNARADTTVANTQRHELEMERLAGQRADAANQKPDHAADTRLDKSYQYHQTRLDKVAAPLIAKADRFATLNESLNARTPQADALVAPEVLSVMAGGQGSGVRINEAEINRVVGGRTNLESLKAALNKWQTDPSKGLSITDSQREQIRSLLATTQGRLHKKLEAIDQAGQGLIDAGDVMGHRRVSSALQQQLNAIDQGTDVAATQSGGKPSAADLIKKYGGQ